MSLPTTTKTWAVSANNFVQTHGPYPDQRYERYKDVADAMSTVVAQLVSLGAFVFGSSDGVNENWGIGSGNYWVVGNTYLQSGFSVPGNGSYPATAFWIVLQFADGQFMMGWTPITRQFQFQWSPGSAFIDPGISANLPSAPDAYLLRTDYYGWYYSSGVFDLYADGIVNQSQNHTLYNLQVQVAAATDGTANFYFVVFRDNSVAMSLYFASVDAPLNAAWGVAKTMYVDTWPSMPRLAGGQNALTSVAAPASTYSAHATATLPYVANGGFGGDGSVRNFNWNRMPDLELGGYDLPILPLYSTSSDGMHTGVKGKWMDLYWAQSGASLAFYPVTAPTQFIQIGDVVFPWSTSAPNPIFAG